MRSAEKLFCFLVAQQIMNQFNYCYICKVVYKLKAQVVTVECSVCILNWIVTYSYLLINVSDNESRL